MPPPHSLLELSPNRVTAALRRVKETVWRERRALSVEATEATPQPRGLAVARNESRRAVASGSAWGRLYDQRWCRVAIPAVQKSAEPYFEWRDQGEATLYVGDVPYYGFDVAHRSVALPRGTREVWLECWCCQSAIWHPAATGLSATGSIFENAYLVLRDETAWSVYHDLLCLSDLMLHLRGLQQPKPPELSRIGPQPSIESVTPLYRRVLRLLDGAVDAYDTGGLAPLQKKLRQALDELRQQRAWIRAVLTGHAHIDLVWLWPERVGEAKAVHTFATVNRLMDLYPEFKFAYSQPASYEAVKRLSPKLHRAVRTRVGQGRWEPTGALQVESDTILPCGEGLARSFLIGQNEFTKLRGSPARLCWLPDVFGYSGCLPQLMKQAGVDWFFTTKLTWSAINRFPYSSFIWRGTDESEVVAHVTQDCGYNNLVDLPRLHAGANGHAQSDIHREYLHPTGYGDGGGGPTEEMCERARRLSALGDTPEMVWDQPEAFFERLDLLRPMLPVYQGECYLEYHRGTYTTRGDLKAAYRALERALQVREAAATATGKTPDLTPIWKRLIFAQFHDYVTGSSVPEVYAEALPELRRLASELHQETLDALSSRTAAACVFNPLTMPLKGWFTRPGARKAEWMEIAPLSSREFGRPQTPSAPAAAVLTGRTLSNGRVEAEIDAKGLLCRLCIDGVDMALVGPGAQPISYPDHPSAFEAWDIDHHSLRLGNAVSGPVTITAERTAGERAVLAVRRAVGRRSELTTRYSVVAGEAVLRIEAEVDWHEEQTLLKLHFPTSYRGQNARFGAPFGSVLRGQQPGMKTVEAQWEVPGSRWAAVAHDGETEGLALIAEAKYGFSVQNGDLSVSLLRSPKAVGFDDHNRAAPRVLSRLKDADVFTDQGRHVIRLAVGRHSLSAPRAEHAAALADTLFTAPVVYRGSAVTSGFQGLRGGESLVPSWAQPLDAKNWLLRLHEVSGQSGYAEIDLERGWTATRCGLDGAVKAVSRPQKRIAFRPYEIVSVRIARES